MEQANKAVHKIFSPSINDLELVLEGKSFIMGDKGEDKFEIDGLFVSSKRVLVVEAKRSLREGHVDQIQRTAGNVTKYWEDVKLSAPQASWPNIDEIEMIRVLVAPYASSEVIAAVSKCKERFFVVTESGDNFDIVYPALQPGSAVGLP